jgi:ATP-dependent RNA/DNA helicase IGHMBP2
MIPYFKKQLDLLRMERKVDEETFNQKIQSASAPQQRENGFAWYPVAIRGQDVARGGYISLEIERTTHQHLAHSLQTGRKAELFSNYDKEEAGVHGIIQHVNGNRLRITLFADELPDWARHGKLGVRCLFDDDSYDAMELALKTAGKEEKPHPLCSVLTGEKAPTFDDHLVVLPIPELNTSQNKAVKKILSANELAIVHGPPGTGKTTTLVAAIQQLTTTTQKPILVVAPSNTAVDLLCERLAMKDLRVIRVGNPIRVSDALQQLTLDHRISVHPDFKRIKELRKRASEFRNMAHKYKRNFGPEERQQRKALFAEAGRIGHEMTILEDFIVADELQKAHVIAATPVGAYNYIIRDLSFDVAVIDEAAQALEAACWIPILKAQKVVLAGDHLQLPPTIKSSEAARSGLEVTLLEKCAGYYPEATVLLEEQYRMHQHIMGFPSATFYDNRLIAHPTVKNRTVVENDPPLAFIDTAGCGFEEEEAGTSFINPEEGSFLVNTLFTYLNNLKEQCPPVVDVSIGVISPYKQQVELLRNLVAQHPDFPDWSSQVVVNTIDGFQGQERDVMFIGMVRSNPEGVTGFLSETRRMNVAMTRARKKLVVVGDSATLAQQPFYDQFIQFTQENSAYKSAWEYM